MTRKSLTLLGVAVALASLVAAGVVLMKSKTDSDTSSEINRQSVFPFSGDSLAIDGLSFDPERTGLSDAAPLPDDPAGAEGQAAVPLPAELDAADDWESLKDAADQGDQRASCKLATRLEGCRNYRELKSRLDQEISDMAASSASAPDQQLGRMADNQDELDGYLRRCGGAPNTLANQEWRYLLAAARSGHEPSMYQFVVSPPINVGRPLEYLDALNAYRQFAPGLVDELLRRGSAEGLVAALFLASGMPIVGESPLYPEDPARAVELAAALSIVRAKPSLLESAIRNHASRVDAPELQRAIADGQRRAASFSFRFADAEHGIAVNRDIDSCGDDWE